MEDALKHSRQWSDKDIGIYSAKDIPPETVGVVTDALFRLMKVIQNKPKSMIVELNVFRKYVPVLIKAYCINSDVTKKALKQVDRTLGAGMTNANKRWTDVEDNALIEMACKPNATMASLSTTFGRTPVAISARITTLVGRKRLSQEIAGRFVGYIDGVRSESTIMGTVYKEG